MQLSRDAKPRRPARRLLLLAALGLGLLLALGLLRVGPAPEIAIDPQLPGIGPRTPITVRVSEPRRGLGAVRVELLQGELSVALAEEAHTPRPFWAFWGPRTPSRELALEVGRTTVPGLREGEATIRVTAERAPTWLRRPAAAVAERVLPVRLVPPALAVRSTQVYVAQGGCEAVVYRVGEGTVRDGVRAGEWWFPGFPLPGGGPGDRFALFAVPYDLDQIGDGAVRLEAADALGNQAQAAFVDRFFRRPPASDRVELSDGFLARVVPEILARSPQLADRGGLLENFLAVNGELRRANAEALRALAAQSRAAFLWERPFLALPNAQVMSAFADRRTYLYQGREVDRQDHLGFDLATTRRDAVPAANDGVVVLADYLGIYGNTVVLDHGYGLMSLYAHLSEIEVAPGQEVDRGQRLGRTGETGLAGGDHLHFTLLLHGLPVTPVEWWDPHWLRDRLARKLGPALPFAVAEPALSP
jgi:murein DD-endopeptidase MepM/ murein hydrolase activator NlpD